MAKIKLTRFSTQPDPTIASKCSCPIRIEAETLDAAFIPSEVFVYQMGMTEADDLFVAVCSATQLADLPATRPEPGEEVVYYRLPFLEVVLNHSDECLRLWEDVQKDVQELVANLTANTILVEEETVEI